ncbi:MbcA/ParS/Xre antitoxin family protein [Hydrogenophaga sp.]|nr:MbcA/ParS/Xre antitoxin family protein [Hydrogenophaga sp.]
MSFKLTNRNAVSGLLGETFLKGRHVAAYVTPLKRRCIRRFFADSPGRSRAALHQLQKLFYKEVQQMDMKSELTELEILAVSTFQTSEDATDWFQRPHPMLKGETPRHASQTVEGEQLVRQILVAIKYGGVV